MNIISPIPNSLYLACSGGSDSMFALHFLRQSKHRKVIPLYFNHDTEFGHDCEKFLLSHCDNIITGFLNDKKPKELSQEEFWRQKRYQFFDQFKEYPIITCHHLNDQIETMLMGFCHGRIRKIPYQRGNYLRPFLNVTKQEILNYCNRHNIQYLDDPSNSNTDYTRNRIRHNVVPELLKVNPGLYKTIRKCQL